jgi:hypothetical protein
MKAETQRFTATDDEGVIYTIVEYEEKFVAHDPEGGGSYEIFSLFRTLEGDPVYQVGKTEYRMVKTDKVLRRLPPPNPPPKGRLN